MTFNPSNPTDTVKIRNLPQEVRNNFQAINNGDSSFKPDSINYDNRTPLAVSNDPAAISDAFIQYCKEDPDGNPELFGINQNSEISQLTRGLPINAANGETYLPGGLLLKYGTFTGGAPTTNVVYTSLSPALTAFPNTTYWVIVNGPTSSLVVSSLAATGFTVATTAASPNPYYFLAIGN